MKRITILLLTVALYGCDSGLHPKKSPPKETSETMTYVLSDRRHPEFEYVYYLEGESVVAQKHVFPGYADQEKYLCEALPKDIHQEIIELVSHGGDITPPIVPGGAWYAIASFEDGSRTSTTYFKNDNHDVARLFSELKNCCMTTPNEMVQLPDNILSHKAIAPYFGAKN